MGTQQIVERILSDAEAEARAIVEEAESKAAKLLAESVSRAEKGRRETEADVEAKRESILEKKAAVARLDGAKLLLAEKRKVIDAIYAEALRRLLTLEKEDALKLSERLLEAYAENGDEIWFAENFRFAAEVELLPVVKERSLRISPQSLPLDGGMRLKGRTSDKDLSYGALLAADRDEYQAEIARKLFK